jgi:hypothetical protein
MLPRTLRIILLLVAAPATAQTVTDGDKIKSRRHSMADLGYRRARDAPDLRRRLAGQMPCAS